MSSHVAKTIREKYLWMHFKLFVLIEYWLEFDQYNIIEMEKDLIQIDCSKVIEYFLN